MSNPPKSTKLENLKEYKQFNRFLDMASNRTKENENKRKTYQTNLNHFRTGLIRKLRGSNKLLEKMYVKEIVSGNYFDCPMDLKYDETNLNIILKIPFGDANSVTVEKAANKPGYCRICVDNDIWKQHETDPLAIEFRKEFLHKNRYLRVNEFTTWFECIFNEHFTENAYELEIGSKNQSDTVKFSISKPEKSVTGLYIEVLVVGTNTRFSVDIGLGMEFDRTVAFCQSKIPASITEKWVAVAKPDKSQNGVDWLCSFYTIERKILQDNPKTGSLIRICKQFCCAANIPNISTYLLENIFFREIVKQENAQQFDFWKSSLASLFLHMFDIILHSLNGKPIPYFWDGAVNLAVKLPHKKMYDILVIHRTELDHKINSSDPDVNFDDLFFKIEDQGNNNYEQNDEIAYSSTPSTKSRVGGVFNFFGFFSKAECKPAENVLPTSPSINSTDTSSNGNIDPVYVRESSSESRSSSLSVASSMSSLVEVIKKPNKSDPLDGLSPKSTKLENYKKHGKFNKFLDTISNQMKQKENHRKTFQTYMNLFMSGLLKKLRAHDKLFDKMCTGHVPSGYFFDEPTDLNYNEYTMTVLLKLPCDNQATIDVAQSPKKRGYCRLIANNIPQEDSVAQEFKTKFVNKDNCLRVNEFYEWFNRIVTEYFTTNCNKMEILKRNNEMLVFEISGVAKSITGVTFKIQVFNENILFLINLGVGIEFDQKYAYCNEKFPQYTLLEPWIAISKFDNKNVQEVDWLCSFNSIERKILQDKKKVVPLIRIVKQFFNAANISNLSTYLIENIFLWEISKQENARQTEFWTSSLASLVLHMIDVILRCLDKKSIPYFWEQSINLLQNVDSTPIHDKIFDQKLKLEMELLNADDSESNFGAIFYLNQNDKETNSDDTQQEISDEFELISLDEEETKNHREESMESATKEMIELDESSITNSGQPPCKLLSSSTSEVAEPSVNETPSKKAKDGLCASQVLELIGNFIQVTDRKEYIKHYNALIKFFVNELKTDETFKHIFKGEVMAGSYRDGLKIMKPNEFDTILRLNFGNKSNLLVERIPAEPIHCTIRVNECEPNAKPYLKKFIDAEGYLLQDAIIVWIQNLFRDKLKPYEINGKIITIEDNSYAYSYSINGPAFTFKIAVLNTDLKFYMDLVPSIPFDFTHWVATRHYSRDSNQIKWIAVPKPPKEGIQRKRRSFTCSYTEMEKDILHDTYQAKNLIRIFKKLRDTQQLKLLKSYFIKTIFLWQFHDTTIAERREFWSRPLHVIFLDMFKKLLNYIQNRNLPFYWEASYNLFTKTGENKLNSWDNKLRPIGSRLEIIMKDDPNALIDIILTSDERKLLESRHPKLCNITHLSKL